MYKKLLFILSFLLWISAGRGIAGDINLSSPDGHVTAVFTAGTDLHALLAYRLHYEGRTVLKNASIGWAIAGEAGATAYTLAGSAGPLDLKQVIRYASAKNIGVILYVNHIALEKQLDSLLPLYHSWGVKGVKFGFVRVGSQQWTGWLHRAVRKAAQYKLIVDVHDEYRPTGYSRTYPNLLSQEGVRGDEESPSNEQTLITLFTRMIAGAADNTNCYFTDRVDQKMGSHGSQLAKTVCLYSPLQFLFWYDRPDPDHASSGREGIIAEVPELAFFSSLPTVWDDTRVLEGEIGSHAVIARRSGVSWFIGALNGKAKRDIVLPCGFLEKGKRYRAFVYADDPKAHTPTHVRVDTLEVNQHTRIPLTLLPDNGCAIRISPLK
ncbi:glycoside hydrolase family 97 catalytic domain-containing protein [Compostibacter hankyongensis]|uniref:Alpha-glucosidase n=1 Tax=Compostibacter hankyongensis TaxID=1007089 RepID=A0ABP8FNW4_9BACT